MKRARYVILLLAAATIFSCGPLDKSISDDTLPIDRYLERATFNQSPHLKITNDALSKDFLLYGNFIPMLNSPTGYSLKSRIVRFEIMADRVVMLESPKGHSLADHNESMILLAEFPIVQSDSTGILIDFAKGMQAAFTMRNVHARAVTESEPGTAEQFKAVMLQASFVRSIDIDSNAMVISQIAQWRNQKSELVSAEFRYFLREYKPSSTFVKKTFGKNRWFQYFSTPPMLHESSTKTFAYLALWDLKDPITFYISANTPTQYRQAIKDGLIFWNHIFQKEVVIVKDLEPGIFAPHPRLNIVQWVPWDNESSAYADIVIDHLTGQTLQAQIYVRSGWVMQSAKKLKNQLDELLIKEPAKDLPTIEEGVPMPSMFMAQDPCVMPFNVFEADLEIPDILEKMEISDDIITKLTNDILRTVIAHEMGHVFGLRHNLAGSLSGTMNHQSHDDLLRNYLKDGMIPLALDKFLSSSIMDVFSAADDALMGAQIRQILETYPYETSPLKNIYTHDSMVINVGYLGQQVTAGIPFCTDEDMSVYLDCRRWDFTNNPFMLASDRLNNAMNQIALLLADTFTMALDINRLGGPLTVQDIPLTNVLIVNAVGQYAQDLFSWFSEKNRSVLIESRFAALGPHNRQEITAARFQFIEDQLQQKDVNQTLFGLLPPFSNGRNNDEALAQLFQAQFDKRIEEKSISLSQAERDMAVGIANAFLANLRQEIMIQLLNTLEKSQFDDINFQTPIEQALGTIAHEILFAKKPDQKPGEIPAFLYDMKTRDKAAHLLSPALGAWPDWSYENIEKAITTMKGLMKEFGRTSDGGINLYSMPRHQRQWMLEQNRILNTLMQVRTQARPVNATPAK